MVGKLSFEDLLKFLNSGVLMTSCIVVPILFSSLALSLTSSAKFLRVFLTSSKSSVSLNNVVELPIDLGSFGSVETSSFPSP